jgi:hypothetical protein
LPIFRKRSPRWIRRLTGFAIALAVAMTLSYGAGAHLVVRYFNPKFGALWNAYEFTMAEYSVAGLGMLIGIRLGARLVEGTGLRKNSMIAATLVGAITLPAVAKVGAEVARYRFTSGAGALAWLIDRYGYDVGMFLDKLLTAGVYSIKVALFALPVGMILFGLAIVFFMSFDQPSQTNTGS